jgi:simple sugar transport system ATP-binding protein
MSAAPAAELRGIRKSFGTVLANRDVSLTLARGVIHGLVGENGAGKSTLMNILYGVHTPDTGAILVGGAPVRLLSPADAIARGIGMVHQHFMLVDRFTVLENLLLGVERGALLGGGVADARAALQRFAEEYGLAVPADAVVETLPVGVQQRVEIVKGLYRGAEILILDEPTAVLTPQETEQLFRLLRCLAAEGKAIVLVTHKLREIIAVTERVTVMRRGSVVAQLATRETSEKELAALMVGREVELALAKMPAMPGPAMLEAAGLRLANAAGRPRLRDVDLTLRAGEIVGIAGIAGNGQSELLEVLAGLTAPQSGTVTLAGSDVTGLGARERRRRGLGHIPEDRLRMGLVPDFAAAESAILGDQRAAWCNRGPFLRHAAIRASALTRMQRYDVRPPDPRLRSAAFSGGNQQKLVCAREMERQPKVLLVGQPTRGVDIGAIEFIHRRLLALRDAGSAILLVSVELDEIRALADRILVMAGGTIVGGLPPTASEQELGLLMAGVASAAA